MLKPWNEQGQGISKKISRGGRKVSFHFFQFCSWSIRVLYKRLNSRISDNLVLHAYLRNKMKTTNITNTARQRRERRGKMKWEKIVWKITEISRLCTASLTLFNRSSEHISQSTWIQTQMCTHARQNGWNIASPSPNQYTDSQAKEIRGKSLASLVSGCCERVGISFPRKKRRTQRDYIKLIFKNNKILVLIEGEWWKWK